MLAFVPRSYRSVALVGDSAELVTAAVLWGVPHPPGYPLFTLIGHAFAQLPWFELPFRVHLTSAIFHAAAAAVVACTIDIATGSLFAASVGAGALVLGRVFFLGSLYAEVFPLNTLLFAWLLFLATATLTEQGSHRRRWTMLAVVLGLALAHHPMIILAVPALVVMVGASWTRERAGPARGGGLVALCLAIPAMFYALVPLAASHDPLLSWGNVHDFASLASLVMRKDYGGPFHPSRGAVSGQFLERLDVLASSSASSFGVGGMLLAAIGAMWTARHAGRLCLGLALAFFMTGPLFAGLNAIDLHSEYRVAFFERFLSMCHVPIAIVAGVGAPVALQWLRSYARGPSPLIRPALAFCVAGLVLFPLLPNLWRLDCSRNDLGLAYARDLIDDTPDDSLILLKGDVPSQAALYACGVERRCGRRIILSPGQLRLPWKRTEVKRRYPELALPNETPASSVTQVLVATELARRAVYVHPELLDDAMSEQRAALPNLLLYRVYPSEAALRDDLARFQRNLEAAERGERCHGCRVLRASPSRLPIDEQIRGDYESAL